MPDNLKSVVFRVSQGDSGAFKELFETFSPRIYGFALKLTHSSSTAEELVQEVFMKIWANRESLDNVESFPAWLHTITRNLAFNVLKRMAIEQKAKTEFVKEMRVESFETEELVVYRDYQNILNNAIDRLSPQQKIVYTLCHGEGLKYEEAAEKLQISRLTVKTHMQHAIRSIKTHFKHIIAISAFASFLSS
jgi:RNA polymerase sigma-70 factor (family 1)